jgi:ribosome-associated translation inhibitor RaiA
MYEWDNKQTKTTKGAVPPTGTTQSLTRAIQSPSTRTSRSGCELKIMKIQINTDNHLTGREALVERAEATITGVLGHLAKHLTRVEVHLSDENGEKTGGQDKRCMMEARLEGRQPIAVTDESDSLDGAIIGAADKLKSSLASTLGRLTDR